MTNYFSLASADALRLTDGTEYTNVNEAGALGVNGASVKTVSFSEQSTSTATTIYTVPADTIAYIIGVQHTSTDYGNSRKGCGRVLANSAVISVSSMSSYSSTGGASGSSHFSNFVNMPIKLTAGQTIQHQNATNGAGYHSGVVFYIEVAV